MKIVSSNNLSRLNKPNLNTTNLVNFSFGNLHQDTFTYSKPKAKQQNSFLGMFPFLVQKSYEQASRLAGVDVTTSAKSIVKSESKQIVTAIDVPASSMAELSSVLSSENVTQSVNSTKLSKYMWGLPLKYPRKTFINDFKQVAQKLSPENKAALYNHFNFSITENNDIIKYPAIPNESVLPASQELKEAILEAEDLVTSFMFENEVQLAPSEKPLEDMMNSVIKIFPEFIPLIGKMQHRGDTIDFHTLDVLKRVVNNPEYKTLEEKDKQLLSLVILFHDYSKAQNKVDRKHPEESSVYAKEIIKKVPLSQKDKDRVFDLIRYSHWTTSGANSDELAEAFGYGDDFKMIQFLALADRNSAGFYIPLDVDFIDEIQSKIDLNRAE